MKSSDRIDAERIAQAISYGQVSRAEVVALLIYLREGLPRRSMLRDIADSMAHPKRSKGRSFEYIKAFLLDLIETSKYGGRTVVQSIFPLECIVQELLDALHHEGVNVEDTALKTRTELFHKRLIDALNGVVLDMRFCPNVPVAFPVFRD